MEAQDYKKLNYNDYTSRSRSRSSSSTSTTMEETRKPLLPLQTQKLIKEVKALYYDAIGSYPSNFIVGQSSKTSRKKHTAWRSWNMPYRKQRSRRVRHGHTQQQS